MDLFFELGKYGVILIKEDIMGFMFDYQKLILIDNKVSESQEQL